MTTSEIIGLTSAILTFVTGGGLTILITLNDKKYREWLENVTRLIDINKEATDRWKEISQYQQQTINAKDADIIAKDKKIDELLHERSKMRDILDERNTQIAVSELLICNKHACVDRDPPYGSKIRATCKFAESAKSNPNPNTKNL